MEFVDCNSTKKRIRVNRSITLLQEPEKTKRQNHRGELS